MIKKQQLNSLALWSLLVLPNERQTSENVSLDFNNVLRNFSLKLSSLGVPSKNKASLSYSDSVKRLEFLRDIDKVAQSWYRNKKVPLIFDLNSYIYTV